MCLGNKIESLLLINEKGQLINVDKNLIAEKLNINKSKISVILFWALIIFLSQNSQKPIFQTVINNSTNNFEKNYF